MSAGYVTFSLGEQTFAVPLDEVREIVRLAGLTALPSMAPPLAGVLDLRGTPLPVLDVRSAGMPTRGDVLVVDDRAGGCVGVAVDVVHAVLGAGELSDDAAAPSSLPPYVLGVRRGAEGVVLLVDLHRLVAERAAARPEPAQT